MRVIMFRRKAAELISYLSNLGNLREQENLQGQLKLPENPEEAGNLMLTLCHQATYLLNKQVIGLEKKHKTEGGYTERLYKKRKDYRGY